MDSSEKVQGSGWATISLEQPASAFDEKDEGRCMKSHVAATAKESAKAAATSAEVARSSEVEVP